MVEVHLQDISRIYGPKRPRAVNRVNITVRDGEFLTLVGPSGSGKSTCLRMLAGLEPVNEGTILIDGVDVTEKPARDRDVAMVFQSYALYPNMTARQNMAFALENAKLPKAEIAERVDRAAHILELEHLLDVKPANMSGGQRQRVSMGRAIVREPKVFLMDEPLSNLDARLRVSTRAQIAQLQRELGITTVYVTHDQTEAMTMGDRVAVLKDGILQQVDEPMHLYRHPGNTFVAGFIGSPSMALINEVEVSREIDGIPQPQAHAFLGPLCRLPIPTEFNPVLTGKIILGVRPEDWEVEHVGEGEEIRGLRGTVTHVEQLGAEAFAYVSPATGLEVRSPTIAVRLLGEHKVAAGDELRLTPTRASFFDPETEINLEYLV
ncbi:ABC transporter ATP-binding protein [Rothia sp. 32237D007AR]